MLSRTYSHFLWKNKISILKLIKVPVVLFLALLTSLVTYLNIIAAGLADLYLLPPDSTTLMPLQQQYLTLLLTAAISVTF